MERKKVTKEEYNITTTKQKEIDGYLRLKTPKNNEPQTEHVNYSNTETEEPTKLQQGINMFVDTPNAPILGVTQESIITGAATMEVNNIIIKQLEIDEYLRRSIKENNDYSNRENETGEPTKVQEEMNDLNIYNINDSVLVRYYERKTWVYYVGFIEGIEIKSDITYYTKSTETQFLHNVS